MSLHLLLPMQTGPFYLGWDISPEWPFGLDVASFPSSLNLRNKEFMVMFSSVQFSSVAQLCPTLWNPMNGSTPGLSVHHQLPEFTQTHLHRVGDAIQPSHPLSSTFPSAFDLSQQQGLSKSPFSASGGQSIGASVSSSVVNIIWKEYSGLISCRMEGWISLLSKELSRVLSNTTVQKHQFFGTQLSLWSNSHIHTQLL